LRVERGRVDVHAGTRLDEVDDDEPDDQRDGADDLEVQQREAAGLADLLHVLHTGDADDDGAEDDRRDDHLDQLDERVAERLHRLAGLRPEVAEDHADDDRGDDLEVQRLVDRLACHGPLLACFRGAKITPPRPVSRYAFSRNSDTGADLSSRPIHTELAESDPLPRRVMAGFALAWLAFWLLMIL